VSQDVRLSLKSFMIFNKKKKKLVSSKPNHQFQITNMSHVSRKTVTSHSVPNKTFWMSTP